MKKISLILALMLVMVFASNSYATGVETIKVTVKDS